MPKQSAKTAETGAMPPQIDINALVQRNGENMKAFVKANEVMLEGLFAMGREIMTFGNTRLTQDLKASEALMRCHGADEAFRLQCDFARDAAQQYLEETTRLMNLTAQLTRDCWAPLQERAQGAIEEIENGEGAPASPKTAAQETAAQKTAPRKTAASEGKTKPAAKGQGA